MIVADDMITTTTLEINTTIAAHISTLTRNIAWNKYTPNHLACFRENNLNRSLNDLERDTTPEVINDVLSQVCTNTTANR